MNGSAYGLKCDIVISDSLIWGRRTYSLQALRDIVRAAGPHVRNRPRVTASRITTTQTVRLYFKPFASTSNRSPLLHERRDQGDRSPSARGGGIANTYPISPRSRAHVPPPPPQARLRRLQSVPPRANLESAEAEYAREQARLARLQLRTFASPRNVESADRTHELEQVGG